MGPARGEQPMRQALELAGLIFQILIYINDNQYNITMLSVDQPAKSVTEKFKKELKSQDFVLITQENKQYKQLIKILQDKDNIQNGKIHELQKRLAKLENQKEQYKTLCNQYGIKIHNYESIKKELIQEYKLLKKEIDKSKEKIKQKQTQIVDLQRLNDILQDNVVSLEQKVKTDNLVIQQLRSHVSKLEKQVIDKKIKIFSHLVGHTAKEEVPNSKKQNQVSKSNTSIGNNETFKTSINKSSTNPQGSKDSSYTNSISFSFMSNESVPKRKESRPNKHNRSIYI